MKNTLSLLFILLLAYPCFAQTAADIYSEAQESYKEEKYKKATKLLDKAIEKGPATADYFVLKSICEEHLKEYQAAYETLNEGILAFPENSTLYNARGNLMNSFMEFELAADDFDKAMEYAETDSIKYMVLMNRAVLRLSIRQFDQAYKDLMEVYQFDSNSLAVLTNLGHVCEEVGKVDEAIGMLERAIILDSTFMAPYNNLGFIYLKQGDYAHALPYFDKIIEMDPKQGVPYSNRSFCKLKMGDLDGAMKDIEKSIKLYPANSWAYKNRALIFIGLEEMGRACLDLETAVEKGFTTMYGPEVQNLQKRYCRGFSH